VRNDFAKEIHIGKDKGSGNENGIGVAKGQWVSEEWK